MANVKTQQQSTLIEVENLHCRRGGQEVLQGLAFAVDSGEIVALLGHNGAGKSTALSILAGLRAADAGTIRVNGCPDPWQDAEARRQIGYLPDRPPLYPHYTVREQLRFAARAFGLDSDAVEQAVANALQQGELIDVGDRPVGKLSRGNQQRVAITQCVLHRPRVILLDEPAAGLDPVQQQRFHSLLRTLAQNAAVIYSTHSLDEAFAISDKILVISHGRQCYFGDGREWQRPAQPQQIEQLEVCLRAAVNMSDWQQMAMVNEALPIGHGRWRITLQPDADVAEFSHAIVSAEWGLLALQPEDDPRRAKLLGLMNEVAP